MIVSGSACRAEAAATLGGRAPCGFGAVGGSSRIRERVNQFWLDLWSVLGKFFLQPPDVAASVRTVPEARIQKLLLALTALTALTALMVASGRSDENDLCPDP